MQVEGNFKGVAFAPLKFPAIGCARLIPSEALDRVLREMRSQTFAIHGFSSAGRKVWKWPR
ncbi:MAG: hypothetical protein EAZ84_04045 [Verrucomicrobia bacterium]|nr:MAG: hypothetical protein EAZ84_04045 [Verrucomicrobiota bacterium]TAE86511.1 MAG: hypothetical protein EAZ82_10780 [Verrucomicrobiota bacterium]TAF24147.1 MAG: hypothetical protein EAZ71_11250 [Verrucomicrobiota bacterium]